MVKKRTKVKEKIKDRRRSFRHAAYLPIKVSIGKDNPEPSLLRNISEHGLSFSMHRPLAMGTIVDVTVPSVSREFTFKAKVVWCRPAVKGINEIGVAYLEVDNDFNTRMVELVCRIDRYRTRALEKGRQLTFEEAASEWIGKFSKFLPT